LPYCPPVTFLNSRLLYRDYILPGKQPDLPERTGSAVYLGPFSSANPFQKHLVNPLSFPKVYFFKTPGSLETGQGDLAPYFYGLSF
jgi:hypothetical protein